MLLLRSALSLSILTSVAHSFTPSFQLQPVSSSSSLLARRRGLGEIISEGGGEIEPSTLRRSSSSSSKSKVKSKKGKNKKSEEDGEDAAISPALAQWMAGQSDDDDDSNVAQQSTIEKSSSASTFAPFDSKKSVNNRRIKQGVRKELEEKRAEQVRDAVKRFESTITDSNNNLQDILDSIRDVLTTLPPVNLKTVTAIKGKSTNDFRLAWVGSDNVISHVGTGLHKVPLARLQEIFLTCTGQNRLELYEVIRILGPFPNVRNTLLAKSVVKGTRETSDGMTVADWDMVMNSMIDGTGKELLADKDRYVPLQVYFADEQMIVAVVPPEDGSLRADPLEENGKHVLVFTREEDMNEKLDALRVS